jgi:hypothetical protein
MGIDPNYYGEGEDGDRQQLYLEQTRVFQAGGQKPL